MNVELIKIKGIEYEINFDMMSIKVFDRDNVKEVHKYLVQRPEDKRKFKVPEKYNKIYQRLVKIEEDKKKKPIRLIKKKPKKDKEKAKK